MSILTRLLGKKAAVVPDPVAIIRREEVEKLRQAVSAPDMDADGNDPMARTVYARIVRYEDGYGYELCVGEVPAVRQQHHPDKEGDVPMTEDEASAAAERALAKYEVD
jgi:hypothetical protein